MGVRAFQNSRRVGWIAGVLGVLAIAGGVLSLVVRVRAGRGIESYITARGYETNAIQALATIILVALLFGIYRVVSVIRGRRL